MARDVNRAVPTAAPRFESGDLLGQPYPVVKPWHDDRVGPAAPAVNSIGARLRRSDAPQRAFHSRAAGRYSERTAHFSAPPLSEAELFLRLYRPAPGDEPETLGTLLASKFRVSIARRKRAGVDVSASKALP